MPGKALELFLSDSDTRELLNGLDILDQLIFVPTGLNSDAPDRPRLSADGVVKRLEETSEEALPGTRRFLVARRHVEIVARPISLGGGGSRYAWDQKNNEQTVIFDFGYQRHDELLLPSRLSTVSKHEESLRLYGAIARYVRRLCTKIKTYWVGADALQLLRRGARLTGDPSASTTYDLREG